MDSGGRETAGAGNGSAGPVGKNNSADKRGVYIHGGFFGGYRWQMVPRLRMTTGRGMTWMPLPELYRPED